MTPASGGDRAIEELSGEHAYAVQLVLEARVLDAQVLLLQRHLDYYTL
jgi:hypothetical protein